MAARQPTTMSWTRSNASSWVFEFRLPKVRSRQPPDSGPARGCNHAHASHHETHHFFFFFFFFFSSPTCFRRLRPKKFHLPTARYFKGPASPKDTAARLSNALFYYQYIYIFVNVISSVLNLIQRSTRNILSLDMEEHWRVFARW